jgi:hypothetical protein
MKTFKRLRETKKPPEEPSGKHLTALKKRGEHKQATEETTRKKQYRKKCSVMDAQIMPLREECA